MDRRFDAQFREGFNQSPPEQKLATLQSVLTRSVITVSACNDLLQHADLTSTNELPADFNSLLAELNNAIDGLKEVLDLLKNSNPHQAVG